MSGFSLSRLFGGRPRDAEAAVAVATPPPEPAAVLTPAPIDLAAPSEPGAAPEEDRPARVLLAEDHPVNRKVVELILGSMGAEITVAVNGAEAVEAFGRAVFDVVLMDMQMPVMDGLAAIRAIRALEAGTGADRTPILSLTANAMPEHVEASFAAGADDHLTKPVSAPVLLARVRAAQAHRRVEPTAERRRA